MLHQVWLVSTMLNGCKESKYENSPHRQRPFQVMAHTSWPITKREPCHAATQFPSSLLMVYLVIKRAFQGQPLHRSLEKIPSLVVLVPKTKQCRKDWATCRREYKRCNKSRMPKIMKRQLLESHPEKIQIQNLVRVVSAVMRGETLSALQRSKSDLRRDMKSRN